MDTPLLKIIMFCFTCCLVIFRVVGGLPDVGGDARTTAMDKRMHKTHPHPCLEGERSALWEFKQSLRLRSYYGSSSYHKTDSWKAGGDCCSGWDGVECDRVTGHVISLDLSDNHINGSLRGNSTLFQLFHLQKLNLSYNNLQGEIPSSIFHLSNLSSLDLSSNYLRLHSPSLKDLVGNLTKLEHLYLDRVDMTGSKLPDSLSNYSFLKSLILSRCGLSGELPSDIFCLSKLRILDLSENPTLGGHFPDTEGNNSLEELRLGYCNFSGKLTSLGRLANLTYLDLSYNAFLGSKFSTFSWISNLTKLTHLDLSFNRLEGEIPNSFSHISQLEFLNLKANNFNGTVELDMFHKLRYLSTLKLSRNNLTLLVSEGTNSVVVDKYEYLGFRSCNLRKFPTFLLNQTKLRCLDLSQNNIHGMVPAWIWNHSLMMDSLNISHNFLTTIEDHPILLPWSALRTLDISFNLLQGSLPVPPLSTNFYLASNNRWSGHLSPLFCNLSHLSVLDVSESSISGTIPQCLGTSLSILDLRNNEIRGAIPQSWMRGCFLKVVALSHNRLQGKVPRSLGNCTELEFIDFGNNQIADAFPSWLGSLSKLKVLMLQSNRFRGEIQNIEGNSQFAQLRVIDLSFNGFSGKIPSIYFESWKYMESLDDEMMKYMEMELSGNWSYVNVESGYYEYSMKIINKGIESTYSKIPNIFKGIDFSHNQFEGEIPASIAKLKGLYLLNLGHNNLMGTIPSWIGDLHQLESLDLSHNKLSGKIPLDLSRLSFLSFLNVSWNNLSGLVPHGDHMDTFGSSSYEGNPGLLADHPIQPPTPTSKTEEEEDQRVYDKIVWRVILMGWGSGFVVGVVLGNELVVKNALWFERIVGMWL